MTRLYLAAAVAFCAAVFMTRVDGATLPCPAGDGPPVWYVASAGNYYARGSAQYGIGSGVYLCLTQARAAKKSAHEANSIHHHMVGGMMKPGKRRGRPGTAGHDSGGSDSAVTDSVYDTISRTLRHEHTGYGRYTYVLLTTRSETERNTALLSSIMETTPEADSVTTPPRYLNVFEIPETATFNRASAKAADPAYTLAGYDFGFAHDLLLRACAAPNRPSVCRGSLTGPFLLTYGKPLGSLHVANPPYLIVDLHYLNPKGFSHVVAMMKEQVKQSDVANGRLVENWSVRLLSTTLDISDWLPNIISSAKQLRGALVAKPASP